MTRTTPTTWLEDTSCSHNDCSGANSTRKENRRVVIVSKDRMVIMVRMMTMTAAMAIVFSSLLSDGCWSAISHQSAFSDLVVWVSTTLHTMFVFSSNPNNLRNNDDITMLYTKILPHSLVLQNWTLSSTDNVYTNLTTLAPVPGDVVSILLHNRIIQDPYQDRNILTQRHIWMGIEEEEEDHGNYTKRAWNRTWVYRTTFLINTTVSTTKSKTTSNDDDNNTTIVLLIFESVKMGAHVHVNDVYIATITDQFLRYELMIPSSLLQKGILLSSLNQPQQQQIQHTLTVSFDPSIIVDGRFAACSGGWDWAPYAQEIDAQGLNRFTAGIVGPVSMLTLPPNKQQEPQQDPPSPTCNCFVSHVVPKIYYLGKHLPTKAMSQHGPPDADFRLDVQIHLQYYDIPRLSTRNNSVNQTQQQQQQVIPMIVLRTDFGSIMTAPIPEWSDSNPNVTSSTIIMSLSMTVPKEIVELWWPHGMGPQKLYTISIGMIGCNDDNNNNKNFHTPFTSTNKQVHDQPKEWIHHRIGFRVTALVTTNETDDTTGSSNSPSNHTTKEEGNGQHGMYLRINGALLMARGANWIPPDQLENRQYDVETSHRIAVQSAAQANMNMIRIWGGGMIPPDAFYDACDEYGILLYHDMMFVDEQGHRPVRTVTVDEEIRFLVRSHASHPSIVVWSGCNECDVVMGTPSEIYATFAMTNVAEEDDTRSIWPSSPSKHGWKLGVRRSNSFPIPNNSHHHNLTTWDPKAFPRVIESHGPYMRSFSKSYPGVNGHDVGFPYKNTPPRLEQVDVGIIYPNEFVSEFGSSVTSSFESMSGTLSRQYWSLHGGTNPDTCNDDHGNESRCTGTNVLAERNYPCDSHIQAYFGLNENELNDVGEYAFQKQLYFCMIAQTLWMKGEIETLRSKNVFGMLIWQLNENWPTGGWGCIEYATKTLDGSNMLGGRWKPLMHLLESSLFRDQFAACGEDGNCYIRNDGLDTYEMTVSLEAWKVGRFRLLEIRDSSYESKSANTYSYNATLSHGQIDWFQLPEEFYTKEQVILITLKSFKVNGTITTDYITTESVYLRTMPKNITGLQASVAIKVLSVEGTKEGSALVSLESDRLALFVVLTTRAVGRFSDNAFTLRPKQKKIIQFHSFLQDHPINLKVLKSSIRVEHLGLYKTSEL